MFKRFDRRRDPLRKAQSKITSLYSETSMTEKESKVSTATTIDHEAPVNPLPVDRQWIRKLLRQHGRPDDEPAIVCAPMVDQSDLPFRLLCRDYGVNLCFTPMVHAKLFMNNVHYQRKFTLKNTPARDRPLIAQICGSDIDLVVGCAKILEPYCDGIDLNCGCPQKIAKRGHYGAYLLEQPDVLLPVVKALTAAVRIPVSVKVRLLPAAADQGKENLDDNDNDDYNSNGGGENRNESPEQAYQEEEEEECVNGVEEGATVAPEFLPCVETSLRLYRQLVDAGVHLLTVHGRTRHQKGPWTGKADWSAIRQVVDELGDRIPIFANGSVSCAQEARQCLEETKCDGIMSSEGLLEYPPLLQSLASGAPAVLPRVGRLELARKYLAYARQYPPNKGGQGSGVKCMRIHIHRFCHADFQDNTPTGRRLRDKVVNEKSLQGLEAIVEEIQAWQNERGHDVQKEDLSWYRRHSELNEDGVYINVVSRRLAQDRAPKVVEAVDEAETCFAGFFGGNDDDDEEW